MATGGAYIGSVVPSNMGPSNNCGITIGREMSQSQSSQDVGGQSQTKDHMQMTNQSRVSESTRPKKKYKQTVFRNMGQYKSTKDASGSSMQQELQ